jgi:hypothetical protein
MIMNITKPPELNTTLKAEAVKSFINFATAALDVALNS